MLWEAVAGRRAFPGAEPAEALATARQRTLPALPDSVPAELAAVITRATAADAAARWPDARALRRALDTYVVAARAARPELPAPAEALASWLRDLDEGEPVVPEIADGAALDDVVTFMDDGEAEVLGQSTQKSIAETVADAPVPVPGSTSACLAPEGGAAIPGCTWMGPEPAGFGVGTGVFTLTLLPAWARRGRARKIVRAALAARCVRVMSARILRATAGARSSAKGRCRKGREWPAGGARRPGRRTERPGAVR